MSRHFTVDEANQHIRIVQPVLRDAVNLKHEHDQLLSAATADGEKTESDPVRARELRGLIRERVNFITGLGIQLKDLDHGLVDFPTMLDGEEVLLCWRLDEPDVGYWHTYSEGYRGRIPV